MDINSINYAVQMIARKLKDPTSDVSAVLGGTFTTKVRDAQTIGKWVALGDSITASAMNVSATLYYSSIASPIAWAQHLSKIGLDLVNAGVAGDRTDQMIARFDADVAPHKPLLVLIEAGTNDVNQGIAEAVIRTNLTTLITKSQALGAKVVVSGIPPRNANTAPQTLIRNKVNRWLADNAAASGYVFVEVNQLVTDPGSSQNWLTNHSTDGTHPIGTGAYKWGKRIAAVLATLFPKSDRIPGHPYDPGILTGNPLQIGTGSTPGAGITGTLSPGWGATASGGGTVTATSSKVARTDDIQGEWMQFVITATSAETAGVRMQMNATTGFTAGTDKYFAFAEYELGTDVTLLNDLSINVAEVAPGSVVVRRVQGMSNTASSISSTTQRQMMAALRKGETGVLFTPIATIDPTATSSLNLEATFSGLGTVRFGRVGIIKVSV